MRGWRAAPGSRSAAAGVALLSLLTCLGVVPAAAAEPELQLRVSREPYYVGVPIDIHVQATGFERDPEPSCDVAAPERGSLVLVGIVPSFSSSVRIVNGRVTQTETATYSCRYRLTASEPGLYRVGPFRMAQGGVERQTQPYALDIQEVPRDPRLRVRVLLPSQPVYLGQQLPLRIEWWLDEQLQDRIRSYSIRSQLFEQDDSFRFIADPAPRRGEQSLEIDTRSGTLALAATVERRREGGRDFLVITAQRTLVPLRAGEYDLGAATVNVEEVTRWKRDLFGGRRPAGTQRLFSSDEPRRLVVVAPPLQGRPASFAGAVGKGFSLEVSADRSVVQLGDPITLTLTVRGDGNLAAVGLPSFAARDELDPEHFRLPEGDVSGELGEDAKVFRLSLRVRSDAVREIPALAYSWFDPDLGEYQTAHSRPIALSVRPAQVISADDVVSLAPAEHPPATSGDGDGGGDEPETPELRGSFSLTGADLSIEQDRAKLLRRSHARPVLQIAAYGGSVAVLLAAFWARRRREIDPRLRERRDVFRQQRRRIAAADSKPRREALAEIAAALREIVACAPELRSEELDRFVRECDVVIYAPDSGATTGLEPELAERAHRLLDTMARELT